MAYDVPRQWVRGDAVTAARMNKYSDSLNAIEVLSEFVGGSRMAMYPQVSGTLFSFQHVHRWLHYNGTGEIVDASNILNTVSLSDPSDGNPGVYDLDKVSWLYYGGYYRVEGSDWAFEDFEP
jgi:hypothetical protein